MEKVRKNIERVSMIRISKDYPIYITGNPKEKKPNKQKTGKVKYTSQESFFGKKKSGLY